MPPILTFGHSPDPDDAFMFYGLATGRVQIPGFQVQQILEDIESLNRRAFTGDLHVTAISAAVYPRVADRYRILATGASMGRGYGPKVLTREPRRLSDLAGATIAIPGRHTTAFLVLRMVLPDFRPLPMPFAAIPDAVRRGSVDAGLVIHEAQLTHLRMGLHEVIDLGRWWQQATGLPLPLGVDVVRRDLGPELTVRIQTALRASIELAYAEETAALAYALQFGRGLDRETGRRFIRMYVNDDTLDMGETGRRALQTLFERAHARGLCASVPPVDPVDGAEV